jgi:Na+-transporting methylmalonyl-CoA/oxaloacetate decarboxylase gamma subunit
MAEDRRQMSEDRGQMSEDRGQRIEDRPRITDNRYMTTVVLRIKKLVFILLPLVTLFVFGMLRLGFCGDEAAANGVDWNYALTTLVIRFIGIFAVLLILQMAMQISGWFFKRTEKKNNKEISKAEEVSEGPTPQEVAAIGIALSLYRKR